jgi:hypothetical protein
MTREQYDGAMILLGDHQEHLRQSVVILLAAIDAAKYWALRCKADVDAGLKVPHTVRNEMLFALRTADQVKLFQLITPSEKS